MSGSTLTLIILVIIVIYVVARKKGLKRSGRGYHDPADGRYDEEREETEVKDIGSGDSDDGGGDD